MNSCRGGLGDLPPWILRDGLHQVVGPITGTPGSARAGEMMNDSQGKLVTVFKRGKWRLQACWPVISSISWESVKKKGSVFSDPRSYGTLLIHPP